MLLEMASGNFFYRLERFAKNDNLAAISISLNMLAEEIQDSIRHQGFTNSNNPGVDLVEMSFILDAHGKIEMANQQACNILSMLVNEIIGLPFKVFLDNSSQVKWLDIEHDLIHRKISEISLELKFKSKSNLVIPKFAFVSSFLCLEAKNPRILITVIHHSKHQNKLDSDLLRKVIQGTKKELKMSEKIEIKALKPKIRINYEDIRKIRKGHDIILHNLEKDFPSLREFALQLGTNEFKLKYGFRELYGTSVHRFLMNERFRKAQMMIQFSDQSLKLIAHQTGFKSISHFSRSFKKHYGYAPSELRKKTRNKEE
jgi:AraC-like DNA-binding protein